MVTDRRRRTDAIGIEVPFLGGAYEGRSKGINPQRSINLFPVFDKNEAKTPIAMYGTPGTAQFSAPATTAIVRGMHVMGSYLYAVVGAVVYEIAANGTATSLGSITTSTGYVGMADNGTQILLVDGTAYGHIITVGTLTDISDGDFPAATDCVFFDGFFIVSVASTGKIMISTQYDGTAWDALDYATAEASPDNLVGIGTTKQNMWLLGDLTGEVYYNSGNVDFPFERVPGAIFDIGCRSLASITEINGIIYWFSSEGTVVRSKGYSYEPVSGPGLNYQFSTYTTTNNAIGFSYTLEGRTFYVLNFPTHGKTWVIDVETLQPHEWQSLDAEGTASHFRGVCSAVFNKAQLIGDRATGKIFTLSMNTYTDNSLLIRRIRRAQMINKGQVNVLHRRLELDFESGVGLNVASDADGYDPQVSLTWSDDDENTWATAREVSLGKYQEYKTRQVWRELGKSPARSYEITIEEPCKIVLRGATMNLLACKN